MAGGTTHHARWPAILFGPGDHHGADNARGLPFGLTANKAADWFSHSAAAARTHRAGSLDDVPPEQNAWNYRHSAGPGLVRFISSSTARALNSAGPPSRMVSSPLAFAASGGIMVRPHGGDRLIRARARIRDQELAQTLVQVRAGRLLSSGREGGASRQQAVLPGQC